MIAGMAGIIAAHREHAFGSDEEGGSNWFDKCECGYLLFGSGYSPEHTMYPGKSYATSAHATHVAVELAKAGYGDVQEALLAAADEMPIETLAGADGASVWLRGRAKRLRGEEA